MLLVSVATNKRSSHAGTSFLHAQKALLNQEFCLFQSISPAAFFQFRWFMFFRSRPKTSVICVCFFISVLFLDLSIPIFYEIKYSFVLFYRKKMEICGKKCTVAKSWQLALGNPYFSCLWGRVVKVFIKKVVGVLVVFPNRKYWSLCVIIHKYVLWTSIIKVSFSSELRTP